MAEFLADPRHHLVVASERGRVVGMASAVHYVHPDKRPELWINEVGVAPGYRSRGIGRRLVQALLGLGGRLECGAVWVLAEPENRAARALYESSGGRAQEAVLYSWEVERGG